MLNGAAGADFMRGLAGADTYVVDNAGDTVDEAFAGSGGSDTVQSTRSFSLVVSSHVMGALEGLTLLGSLNISGTGNGLNNLIIGNSGNNALAGNAGADSMRGNGGNDVLRGGAGSDTMTGGAGSDAFLFDSPIGGIDRITDFNTADTSGWRMRFSPRLRALAC